MFERFPDKQRLRGRAVDIFWSERLRELVFPHEVGKCRHHHHRRSRAIIDASVVPNTLLNLKHRGKWFAPMRQFVDRRGRDWSCEVPSEVRCKRRECGHARNRLWMTGSKRVPCD
jgi:hypothetical protein